MSALSGLREAFGWLTVLPVRPEGDSDPVPWFSWIGGVVGAVGAGVAFSVSRAARGDLGCLLAGVSLVAAWATVTGMLHLDGLADAADARAAGRDRERRLAIMRDSRIGSYGAATLVLTLMLQAAAGAVVVSHAQWWTIVWASIAARFGGSVALCTLAPARRDGLAVRLASRRPIPVLVAGAIPVAALAVVLSGHDPLALIVGLAAALAVPRALARPVGGITGDLIGAGIVLTETATLLASALAGR
ncbi:adenosylcobinamide-GDP ribazoletransferase [Coriobacteriia bacterium Es71-Z0120]|uniref:adenosylcobinamide-GDP ribazoletransferase n=1 Tax=Parvivirga hydrogeniphila TaxID=2939460 RepID=UPI002260A9CD|nr:adenosylcobinamide-GDP ribazoletransferase [Parvivirga hydrogeniphila]MCL4079049.1 adenosylcobinamide-GDP ribazoletransferase [Parvivirga hydrogeniphila]